MSFRIGDLVEVYDSEEVEEWIGTKGIVVPNNNFTPNDVPEEERITIRVTEQGPLKSIRAKKGMEIELYEEELRLIRKRKPMIWRRK